MTGWTPLFQQIIGSSIWGAENHIRIAWITMLAVANKDGIAPVTAGGLARLANISREEAAEALEALSSPDDDTLTQEFEGRRIERCDTGWRLLNFVKYRDMAKKAIIREQNRTAQAEWRASQDDDAEGAAPPDPPEGTESSPYHKDARTVLHLVNEISGSKFGEVDSQLSPISARLKEKDVTLESVKTMLVRQWKAWEHQVNSDGKPMREFFRPATLFAARKFDGYHGQRDMPIVPHGTTTSTGLTPQQLASRKLLGNREGLSSPTL